MGQDARENGVTTPKEGAKEDPAAAADRIERGTEHLRASLEAELAELQRRWKHATDVRAQLRQRPWLVGAAFAVVGGVVLTTVLRTRARNKRERELSARFRQFKQALAHLLWARA